MHVIIEERDGDELVSYRKYELAAPLPHSVHIMLSPFEVTAAEVVDQSWGKQFKRRPLAPLVELGKGDGS
jgi:hypothetical protein